MSVYTREVFNKELRNHYLIQEIDGVLKFMPFYFLVPANHQLEMEAQYISTKKINNVEYRIFYVESLGVAEPVSIISQALLNKAACMHVVYDSMLRAVATLQKQYYTGAGNLTWVDNGTHQHNIKSISFEPSYKKLSSSVIGAFIESAKDIKQKYKTLEEAQQFVRSLKLDKVSAVTLNCLVNILMSSDSVTDIVTNCISVTNIYSGQLFYNDLYLHRMKIFTSVTQVQIVSLLSPVLYGSNETGVTTVRGGNGMSERAVSKRIMAAIENSSLNEVTVILNGRPELRAGKLVYAALDTGAPGRDPELIFYTRQSAAGTVTQKTRVDLPNFYEYLVYALLSNELYGVKVPGEASLSCCTISVCNEMRCLLLESHLYANTRKLVGENYNSVVTTFKFGRDYLSEEDCRKLREAFKNNSYADYDALFFESRSRKFLNKLKYRSKDFYGIQSSFIPVFLNYTKVYNPLLSNPLVLKTDLYKKAAEKGRYEERGSLSCYYLTHREICEALHMDRFMRFTSSFLYKVFVGLLFPDNLYFPSEGRNVIVRPDNDEDLVIVRRPVFSEPEFVSVVAKYQNLLKQEDITDTARSDAQRALRELGTYEKQSSLFYLCKTNASVLSNVGCTYIDDDTKKTAAAYYEYVKAASL